MVSYKVLISRLLVIGACLATCVWFALGVDTLFHLGFADREGLAETVESLADPHTTRSADGNDRQHLPPANIASDVREELDRGLVDNSIRIAFGFGFGVVALFLKRFRAILTLVSSLIFWLFWYNFGLPISVSLSDAYTLKWETAKTLDMIGIFLLKDIAAPLAFGYAILISLVSLAMNPRRQRQ